ncbi:hypothetical protein ACFLS1_05430 [Verrucomicrobiota bacterium]
MRNNSKQGMTLLIVLFGVLGILLIAAFFMKRHSIRSVIEEVQQQTEYSEADRIILEEVSNYKAKPLPFGKEAKTCADFLIIKKEFNKRVVTQAYEEFGKRDAKWDAAALSYFSHYVDNVVDSPGCPNNDVLLKEVKALISLGCDDSLVLYTYGDFLKREGELEESAKVTEECFEEFSKEKYPAKYRAFRCALRLAEIYKRIESKWYKKPHFAEKNHSSVETGRYEKWASTVLDLLPDVVAEGTYFPEEKRLLLDLLLYAYNTLGDKRNQVYETISKCEEIDPWILKVISGKHYIDLAWESRGNDWANNVSREGWRGFRMNIRKARDVLTGAWEIHPEYPEAAHTMITVAAGSSNPQEMRMWLDRAVAAQFDYTKAYYSFVYYLRPRWFGSHDHMYAFAQECLDTERFDTEIPIVYVETLIDISGERGDFPALFQTPEMYKNICKLYDGLIKEPARINNRSKDKTFYGIFAWAAGDYKKATSLFNEVGEALDERHFKYMNANSTNVIGESLLSGQFKSEVLEAGNLIETGEFMKAANIYDGIRQKENVNKNIKIYLNEKITDLKTRSALEDDLWDSFMPPQDFAGWNKAHGKWNFDKDGWLRGETVGGRLEILCNTPVGDNFEIKGKLKLSIEGAERGQMGAILMGYSEVVSRTFTSLRVFRFQQQAWLGRRFKLDHKKVFKANVKEINTFHIQVWDRHITALFNEERLFSNEKIPSEWWGGDKGLIGFGEYYQSSGFVIWYRNIEIRRLKGMPDNFLEQGKDDD